MCIFAFAETESNYPYTHSAWHVCMAVSVLFLLPDKKQKLRGMTCFRAFTSNYHHQSNTRECSMANKIHDRAHTIIQKDTKKTDNTN